MYGIAKYIEQNHPGELISTTYWINDKGTGLVNFDLSGFACTLVIYNTFVLTNNSAAPITATITDVAGQMDIMTVSIDANTTVTVSQFGHVVKSNQVRLTASPAGIIMNVGYQYLTPKVQTKKMLNES